MIEPKNSGDFGEGTMPDEWIDEQRKRLAEEQQRIEAMKAELPPKHSPEPPRTKKLAAPVRVAVTAERLQKRLKVIVIILIAANASNAITAASRWFNKPRTTSLIFPKEQVIVTRDVGTGEPSYLVEIPLDKSPYRIELYQQDPTEFFGLCCLNLVLAAAIAYTFRQQSKLEQPQ